MAICEYAVQKILPESRTQAKITPLLVLDHTQAGTGSLYNYWNTAGIGLECHFWVRLDGLIEQYMDTEVQADANYRANRWVERGVGYGAISIETENSREATNLAYRGGRGAAAFNEDPWTKEQLASLALLHDWCARTHTTIKRQKVTHGRGTGLGYHSLLGTGPTDWIPNSSRGKQCPGLLRIKQWEETLLPNFTKASKPQEPGKVFTEMNQKDVEQAVHEGVKKAIGSMPGWILTELQQTSMRVFRVSGTDQMVVANGMQYRTLANITDARKVNEWYNSNVQKITKISDLPEIGPTDLSRMVCLDDAVKASHAPAKK